MRTENTAQNAGDNDVKDTAETSASAGTAPAATAVMSEPKRIGKSAEGQSASGRLTAMMALEEPAAHGGAGKGRDGGSDRVPEEQDRQ